MRDFYDWHLQMLLIHEILSVYFVALEDHIQKNETGTFHVLGCSLHLWLLLKL